MSQAVNLQEIERKVWMSNFQDGLWDLYLGSLLLVMGINELLADSGLSEGMMLGVYVGVAAIVMLAFWVAKRFITRPRIGRAKPGLKARARQRKVRILLTVSVIFGAVVFVATLAVLAGRLGVSVPWLVFPAIYSGWMLVIFGLGAVFLEFNRLFLIGAMYALPVPLHLFMRKLVGIDIGYLAFAGPATIILIVGLVVLARFLRENPPVRLETPNGEA